MHVSAALVLVAGGAWAQIPRVEVSGADADRALTVYRESQTAVVRDARTVTLPAGRSEVFFADVPASAAHHSFGLRVLRGPGTVRVVGLRSETGPPDPGQILSAFLGQQITLVSRDAQGNEQRQQGTLLRVEGSRPAMVLIGDTIVLRPMATVELPRAGAGPIPLRSGLVWVVEASAAGDYVLEAVYTCSRLSWEPIYTLHIAQSGTQARFAGAVRLKNDTGAGGAFTDVAIELAEGAAAGPEAQRVVSYTLPQNVSLPVGAELEVPIAASDSVPVRQLLLFEWHKVAAQGAVKWVVNLNNDQASGLGVPLPAGRVRVVKEVADHQLQLAGDASAPATAVNATWAVYLGDAVGLKGIRRDVAKRELNPETMEETYEIIVTSAREAEVEVTVVEQMRGQWEISKSSVAPRQIAPDLVQFALTVPPSLPAGKEGQASLQYTVEIKK